MGKPFIKILKTVNGYYFFDVNKNEIVNIDKDMYHYLYDENKKLLNENVKKKYEDLRTKGYLSDNRAKEIGCMDLDIVEALLKRCIKQLILQLTQRCNLRCAYCAYTENVDMKNHRSHADNDMTWDIAKRAIDYFWKHSLEIDTVNIGFYGGEPLLCFDLLKRVVIYTNKLFHGKKLNYSITTNGTILTDEIIKFFIEHDIRITFSLDGNEKIHNRNRRFASNGKGSYNIVKKNLLKLKNEYPEFYKKCSINMVFDPQNDFDDINDFFLTENKELSISNIITSEIDDFFSHNKVVYEDDYTSKKLYHLFLTHLYHFGRIEKENISGVLTDEMLQSLKISGNIMPKNPLGECEIVGGSCVPGQVHMLCDYKGTFFPCERVNEKFDSMMIGNVFDGLDYSKINNSLLFLEGNEKKCLNCWVCRNCFMCVRHAASDGKVSLRNGLISNCFVSRRSFERAILLKIFYEEMNLRYIEHFGGIKHE